MIRTIYRGYDITARKNEPKHGCFENTWRVYNPLGNPNHNPATPTGEAECLHECSSETEAQNFVDAHKLAIAKGAK